MPSARFAARRLVAAAAVALVAGAGCSSGDDSAEGGEGTAGWRVGSCVRQTAGPETIPPDVPAEDREVFLAQQQFEPVACTDEWAVAEITALGAEIPFGEEPPADDGCPADTDVAYRSEDFTGLDARVVCARNLEPPHPGDPGGGGGDVVVGDCVVVTSSGVPALNDGVYETPCDVEGWFGTVLATAPDAGGCPAEAVSRVGVPQRPGEVLCLGRDGSGATGGLIPVPGECMDTSQAVRFPPLPLDCADIVASRFEGFPDASGLCPDGDEPTPMTGYDRPLCLGRAG